MEISPRETPDIKPGRNFNLEYHVDTISGFLDRSAADTLGAADAIVHAVRYASSGKKKVLRNTVRHGRDEEKPLKVAVYGLDEVEEIRKRLNLTKSDLCKYVKIGNDRRLYEDDVKALLPSGYTVLYAISTLKERNCKGVDEFKFALDHGYIRKDTERKEIEDLKRELRGESEPTTEPLLHHWKRFMHYWKRAPMTDQVKLADWMSESSFRQDLMAALKAV